MSFKTSVKLLEQGECLPVNCRICGGELIPALSPKAVAGETPQNITRAEHSASSGMYYVFDGESMYASISGGDFLKITVLQGEFPFTVEEIANGQARTVTVNGGRAVMNANLNFRTANLGDLNLRSGVMHCGRLFGIDAGNSLIVRWSGAGGFNDWTEGINAGGSLTLDPDRGAAWDILEFGEKLVVVRKFGLTLLNMYGSPENFSVSLTDTDTDEIYAGTARVVGGKLFFYTASGLCVFSGTEVCKIAHRCAWDISDPVCSTRLGSKYFLSCTSKTLAGKAILCYDSADGESYLIDAVADAMCASDKVYIYNSEGAFYLACGGEWAVTCKGVNFGSGRLKTVTAVFSDGEAEIEISNGRVSRKIKTASGLVKPRLRGESFSFKLSGNYKPAEDKRVRSVTVTAEECNAI